MRIHRDVDEPTEHQDHSRSLAVSPESQPFLASRIKRPYSSEKPNRLRKHDFRAENPDVSSEWSPMGRRQVIWIESQRVNSTFIETELKSCKPDFSSNRAIL
jgi:hypothetical protein